MRDCAAFDDTRGRGQLEPKSRVNGRQSHVILACWTVLMTSSVFYQPLAWLRPLPHSNPPPPPPTRCDILVTKKLPDKLDDKLIELYLQDPVTQCSWPFTETVAKYPAGMQKMTAY